MYGLSCDEMKFDLSQKSKVKISFLLISQKQWEIDYIYIVDIKEIVKELSFGEMTFELDQRTKMPFSLIWQKQWDRDYIYIVHT